MAANANPKLSTITSPVGAVPEDLPVVEVSESTSGVSVSVKWGYEGITQPNAKPHSTYFVARNGKGKEPTFKEFGALLHCDGGTLTIQGTEYRIQVIQQQQQANGKKCFRFGSFVRSFVVVFIQIVLG